jgi:hypothetical protein
MQAHKGLVVAFAGTYPIRITPDQETGELPVALLQFDDNLMARLPPGNSRALPL